ncbi:CapA family protein [Clostridium sp.]|uniref:CapA family protein n=1 Tax=Clostridium sp. TaxID=1506 RepID=UPI002FC793B8
MGRIQRRRAKRKKLIYKYSIIAGLVFLVMFAGYKIVNYTMDSKVDSKNNYTNIPGTVEEKPKEDIVEVEPITPEPEVKKAEIVITSTGDSLLGSDQTYGYNQSLPHVLEKNNNDLSYFYSNVSHIFKADDITTTNLETPLTKANAKAEKQFAFKGNPEYAKALGLGGIEAVNLSNNHMYDYFQKGFDDTIVALKAAESGYFGEGNTWIKEVKGVKVGFLGYLGYYYDKAFLGKVKKDIQDMKTKSDFVVINFHWGEERMYSPNETQKYIAHYAIDQGADLIVGHHPHVIQGLENYKGKIIAYSLGNFAFGGNRNPSDKDTFILQIKLNFVDNKVENYGVKVIPASISSITTSNDYRPTPLTGAKRDELLAKINKLSFNLGFKINDEFISVLKEESIK